MNSSFSLINHTNTDDVEVTLFVQHSSSLFIMRRTNEFYYV